MSTFGSTASGALGGAGSGAGIGAMIGSIAGPPGMAIGAGIGAGIGAIAGGIAGFAGGKEQQSALDRVEGIPEFDPMQLAFLDALQREKRSLESGFTTDFQVAKDLNQEMLAGGLSVAEAVGASNPALAISAIDQSGRAYNTGINQALGTISSRGFGMTQSIGDLINRVSQRKLDVETYKTTQELGIATSDLRTFNQNMMQMGASGAINMAENLPSLGGGQVSGQIGSQAPILSNFDNMMQQLGQRQVSPALSLPY